MNLTINTDNKFDPKNVLYTNFNEKTIIYEGDNSSLYLKLNNYWYENYKLEAVAWYKSKVS